MVRRSSFKSFQPHHFKGLLHPLPNLVLIQFHIEGTKSHIIKDCGTEQLVLRALKDETHPSPNFLQVFFLDGDPQDHYRSRSHQGSNQVIEEGGFARSVWSETRYGLLLIDLQ